MPKYVDNPRGKGKVNALALRDISLSLMASGIFNVFPLASQATSSSPLASQATSSSPIASQATSSSPIATNITTSEPINTEPKWSVIPIAGGYGEGKSSVDTDLKTGYFTGKNMIYNPQKQAYIPFTKTYDSGFTYSGTLLGMFINNDGVMVIATTNGYYFSKTSGSSFTSITCSHTPSHRVMFAGITELKVVCWERDTVSQAVLLTFDSSFTTCTSSVLTTGSTNAMCAVEHQDRLLLSYGAKIWYSNTAAYETGIATNFVNVGPSTEDIVGLYNYNNALIVVKTNSIWVKSGIASEMKSNNFDQLVPGIGAPKAQSSCIGDGKLFFFNKNGVYVLQGGEAQKISTPIDDVWKRNSGSSGFIKYYNALKWLFCKPTTQSNTFIFDFENNRWYNFDALNIYDCAEETQNSVLYFGGDTGDHKIYYINNYHTTPTSGAMTQQLKTAFTPLDNIATSKFLNSIKVIGSGITNVKAYCKSGWGNTSTSEINESTPNENIDGNGQIFKLVSVEVNGTGIMEVACIALKTPYVRE